MMHDDAAAAFREFVAVIKSLRTPGTGCPWDLEQDHRSLRPYLVEETYEVIDAIDRRHDGDLREELGDLLLQVVLHAQIAADRNEFSILDVLRGIIDKMIRRHPHVFGAAKVLGTADVLRNWEAIKAAEKDETRVKTPLALPALLRAQKAVAKQKHASDAEIKASLRHRLETIEQGRCDEQMIGPLLLDVCRLAESAKVNAEDALREALRNVLEAQN